MNDMRVVDVKYDEYALIHTIKTKGSDVTVVNKLYGKGPVVMLLLNLFKLVQQINTICCARQQVVERISALI